jgi:type VI secretion system Hcp family effector
MKRKMWCIGFFAVLLTILGLPSIASAAGPAIFVNFGDIKGNAIDENHKDWVDALGISEALAGPPLDAQGRNVKATYSPFQITKVWDAASPKLREAALKGTHIPEVVVELTPSLDTMHPVLRITLKEVLITTVSMTVPSILGTSISDTIPVTGAKEVVTLVAGAVQWEFFSYKADGSVGAYVTTKWAFVQGAFANPGIQ